MKPRFLLISIGLLLIMSSCSPPVEPGKEAADLEETPQTLNNPDNKVIIIVSSTDDDGMDSFRQTLLDAQAGEIIQFDPDIFPSEKPSTISVLSELPHLQKNNITIDASNTGVVLDGSQITGEWIAGLQLVSTYGNKIMGLKIINFPGPAITISGSASENVIGGDRGVGDGPFGQGNQLIQNAVGVDLSTQDTFNNLISGNLIGTDSGGTQNLGNYRSGVSIGEGAHGNIIGPDNIIAFNTECGVVINDPESWDNTITGNNIFENGNSEHCYSEVEIGELAEGCPDCSEDPISPTPSYTIFHNGHIITMDKGNPIAEAIAVSDGIIIAVGNNEELLSLAGVDDVVIDLNGKTLMPGFVDAHNHLMEAHRKDFEREQDLILTNGVTTIGILYAEQLWIDELTNLNEQEGLKIRINLYLTYSDACGDILGDWYAQYAPTKDKSAMLRIAGIKVFADGGSCNTPAVGYDLAEGGQGDLYFTQDEMNQIIIDINNNGFQAAIHALGDRAADQVLNAIKNANSLNSTDMRNRIEHNTIITDEMLGRHDESGVVATIFGNYPTCFFNGENWAFAANTPEHYKRFEWRWKDLIDANPNTVFAWHSDASTISGPKDLGIFTLNPFENLLGFVARRDVGLDGAYCEPQEWMLQNTISVEKALRLMTFNSAYALNMEDVIGSLESGKFADMIVLSADPLSVDIEEIDKIVVLMTMVQGEIEYCVPGSMDSCP